MTDLEQVTNNGFYIKNIEHPSEELQLAAVKFNPMAIKYIKSPTEKVCMEAVSHEWKALKYIKNQTVEVCKVAVCHYPGIGNERIVDYINEECWTEEFCKYALLNMPLGRGEIAEYMPYEICEKVLGEIKNEVGEESLGEDIERFLGHRKLSKEKYEAAMAMLGSEVEAEITSVTRENIHLFYADILSCGETALVGFEQFGPKIEGRVVGVAQMYIYGTDFPLILLCPKDKVLSKKEIVSILQNTRRTINDIHFDEGISNDKWFLPFY